MTFDGTTTFSGTGSGVGVYLSPDSTGLVATTTDLTLASITPGTQFILNTGSGTSYDELNYERGGTGPSPPYPALYDGYTDTTGYLWENFAPSMGGTNPWVIAVAQSTAVPEPSTLAMAGLVSVCGIAYSLARRRRAQRMARNEP